MIPVLLTPEEVAEKLKVTRRSVYAWLLSGRLAGLRAGDAWRVPEESVLAFLEGKQPTAPVKKAKRKKAAKRAPRGGSR